MRKNAFCKQGLGLAAWLFILMGMYGCGKQASTGSPVELDAHGCATMAQAAGTHSLEWVDTVRIPFDSLSALNYSDFQFKELAGEPMFMYYDRKNSAIQVYNLSTESKERSIPLSTEGPNAVRLRQGFYVHNFDSIFVFSGMPNTIFLVNGEGRKLQEWQFELKEDEVEYALFQDEFFHPYYDAPRGVAGFWVMPWIKYDRPEYAPAVKAAEYSLTHDSVHAQYGSLPAGYTTGETNYYPFSMLHGGLLGNELVLHAMCDNAVQVYDAETKALKHCINLKSQYAPSTFKPMFTYGAPPVKGQEREFIITSPYYLDLFANENQSRYYRLFKHEATLQYADGTPREYLDRPFSVMVLNEKLELLTEQAFPGDYFNIGQAFAWQDKLYLSMQNDLAEAYSEDFLQFAVLTLN